LSVWLKRQEAQAYQARIFAQGLADVAVAGGGKEQVSGVFKSYIEALFPFMRIEQAAKDAEMKQAMKKEIERGVITFKPVAEDFLRRRVKTMELPEDFKKKLAARRGK